MQNELNELIIIYVKYFINSASGTSYFYPIGDASSYVPLTFNLTSATLTNAYLTIYTKNQKMPMGLLFYLAQQG